jgi:hypothetical protein
MLLFFILPSAIASFGQVKLTSGAPEFEDCLESDCANSFYSFLTHSMLEQGFTIQSRNMLSSSLATTPEGWFTGTSLSTFPFHPPQKNLSGKEENTSFSPLFPRIQVGHRQEEYGCGLSLLPPVPVKGAAASFASVDYNKLLKQSEKGRTNIAFELSGAHIKAPITASEEQHESKESFDNLNDETYQERCASQENGCIDTFALTHLSGFAGHAWSLNPVFQPYAQAGLTFISEWLYVMYDDTSWNVLTIQPSAQAGGIIQYQQLLLILNGSVALQHRENKIGAFSTIELHAGWIF